LEIGDGELDHCFALDFGIIDVIVGEIVINSAHESTDLD
jgi:hypothetical protein